MCPNGDASSAADRRVWDELAIIASTWGAPNQTGTWTFCLFWAMRQSAKLNFFPGVLNLDEQFIPP